MRVVGVSVTPVAMRLKGRRHCDGKHLLGMIGAKEPDGATFGARGMTA